MRRRLISFLIFLGLVAFIFSLSVGEMKLLLVKFDLAAAMRFGLVMGLAFGGMAWGMFTRPAPEDLDIDPRNTLGNRVRRHFKTWNPAYFGGGVFIFLYVLIGARSLTWDNFSACAFMSGFATIVWCGLGHIRNTNAQSTRESVSRQEIAKELHDAIVTWGKAKLAPLPEEKRWFVLGMLNRPMHVLHMIDKNKGWWNRNYREYSNGALNTQLEFLTIISRLDSEVDPLYRDIVDGVIAVALSEEPEIDKVTAVIEKLKS